MLGLKLRAEFLTDQMRDTAIKFHRADGTGALDRSAKDFLEITYPTEDVRLALVSLAEGKEGRPVVMVGDRGRGKSHILAVLHHAIASPDHVEKWAADWGVKLGMPALRDLKFRRGFLPITELLHNYGYSTLWDVLLEKHPTGLKYRGKWEMLKTPVFPRGLLEEMLQEKPVALILDELQTWYDGLIDEAEPGGQKLQKWAFVFLQMLAEVASERPDLLVLLVSVRDHQTEAYQQIHRVNPELITFGGAGAKADRKRLVAHRLFENRRHISPVDVTGLVRAYGEERHRLLLNHVPEGDRDQVVSEVAECWPFSPELLDLLEEQILLSRQAQSSRDLIKVLARLFKDRGEEAPLLTPADFDLRAEAGAVPTLLEALADEDRRRLRDLAQRNLADIMEAKVRAPHVAGILSALWVRSIAPGQRAGATREQLQLDVSAAAKIDPNSFGDELEQIQEHSFNIHDIGTGGRFLQFKMEENQKAKLKSHARNDKLFSDGQDLSMVRKTLLHVLTPTLSESSRVIVLGPDWKSNPWKGVEAVDLPSAWDRPVLMVLPELPTDLHAELGNWLRGHVNRGRNMVRFLLPKAGKPSIYADKEILFNARAVHLSREYGATDPSYKDFGKTFDDELRRDLKVRYDRFAILKTWDYPRPEKIRFHVENHHAQNSAIPGAVETSIQGHLFDLDRLEERAKQLAQTNQTMAKLLQDLQDPPASPDEEAIPYLGEAQTAEKLTRIAKTGRLYLNVDGSWIGKRPEHEDDTATLRLLQQRLPSIGKALSEVRLGLPEHVGASTPGTIGPGSESGTGANTGSGSTGGSRATGTDSTSRGTWGPTTTTTGAGGDDTSGTDVKETAEGSESENVPVSGTETTGNTPTPKLVQRRSEGKNGVTLSAEFDGWGLKANDVVPAVRLEFTGVKVAELKTLLQRLPPAIKANLEVDVPGGAEDEG